METSGPGEGYRDLSAMPGLAPRPADDQSAVTLEVDGEIFALAPDEFGGTHYDWLSGPNPDYGFAVGPTPPDWSLDDHRACIRIFLEQIDPRTGYIGDD